MNKQRSLLLTRIAQEHLDLETLETRHWDRLDFKEVSVWGVKHALEAAYQAGLKQGQKAALPPVTQG